MVSVDSRIPNKLILEPLRTGKLPQFSKYRNMKPEYRLNHSRIDFYLSNGEDCLVEVKSYTLIKEGVVLFPDALTERGRRHLMELINAKKGGRRAPVLFLVQRVDA